MTSSNAADRDPVDGNTRPTLRPRIVQSASVRLRNEKISEGAARALVRDLTDSHTEPGAMLRSEVLLADTYGVGRSSIREALRILEVQGIILMKAGTHGGPMFLGPSAESLAETMSLFFHLAGVTVEELLVARTAVEPVAARLAALNQSDSSIPLFAKYVAQEEEDQSLRGQERDRHTQSSLEFHELVCASSGNALLDIVANALVHVQIQTFRQLGFDRQYDHATRQAVTRVHRRIARAILDGDGTTAESLTATHLQHFEATLRRDASWLLSERIAWYRTG